MTMVHQFIGVIWVRTDSGTYSGNEREFESESGESMPALPANVTERVYEPDQRHALMSGNDVVDGGPLPWPDGDAILAQADKLLQRQSNRQHYDELRVKMEEQRKQQEQIDEIKRKHQQEQDGIARQLEEAKTNGPNI